MEIEVIERLITSVGFPIVMCGLLIYYIVRWLDKQNDELKELRKVINDNTNALTSLQTLIKTLTRDEK